MYDGEMELERYGPYVLCGWKVTSDFPLPELAEWNATQVEYPEETLRIEREKFTPIENESALWTDGAGTVFLRIPEVACFRVNSAADCVTIQTEEEVDPVLLRSYLLGSVLALLCYRRGFFPLHGSAVFLGSSAVVFSGVSGAGKSTLATALTRHGHPLLCDDVCAIDLSVPERPLLRPAFPRVKLLSDAIDSFQLGAATIYSRAVRGTKGHFGMAAIQSASAIYRPVPLTAVYALDAPGGDEVIRTPLRGKEAFVFLNSQAHRAWMARDLEIHNQLFQYLTTLASSVSVYRLTRPHSLKRIGETVRLLESAHVSSRPPAAQMEEQHADDAVSFSI